MLPCIPQDTLQDSLPQVTSAKSAAVGPCHHWACLTTNGRMMWGQLTAKHETLLSDTMDHHKQVSIPQEDNKTSKGLLVEFASTCLTQNN